jgi:uncharacterized protein (TIRG00374 family)
MRRIAGGVVAVVVVVVVFAVILPRIADYGAVWDVISGLSAEWILALAAATTLNVVTFAPPWMAALPGLRFGRAMVLTQSSTALSIVLPGGDAVGIAAAYAMLRGWRFENSSVAVAVVVTGAWNQMVNVGLPVLALALLLLSGGSNPLLLTAGVIGIAVLVAAAVLIGLALRGDARARSLGERAQAVANRVLRLVRRPPRAGWGDGLAGFRRRTIDIVSRRWVALTVATVAGHLAVFGVLLVALRATGVGADEVTFVEALAAWGLVRMLTAVPVTPGGVGVVELGLSTALVGFGANNAGAVAAVLLYRVLTVVPTLVLGAVLGLTWRRGSSAAPA